MDTELSIIETRVIGCLLEKESTTPDQYPLSLNGLTVACNQKSNREPVMQLTESEVQDALDTLASKRLIREESGFGSRVVKYKHRFCNTEFSELQLSAQERGILCVLFLRGPQTPGELRTRTNRLCEFSDVHQVENCLQGMAEKETSLVVKLPREAGKRESRYAHLFNGEIDLEALQQAASTAASVQSTSADNSRIDALEQTVAALQEEVAMLKQKIEELGG